jgi:hypothetical protein
MSLITLENRHFRLNEETKLLCCNNRAGMLVVLFYSESCKHCTSFVPLFRELPNKVDWCTFSMVNLKYNKSLLQLSKESTTNITHTPYIILYINGKPSQTYIGSLSNQIYTFLNSFKPTIHPPPQQVFYHIPKIIEEPNKHPEVVDEEIDYNEQLSCVVCMTNKKKIAGGCGHLVVCGHCSIKIDKCPTCRKPWNKLRRIYF